MIEFNISGIKVKENIDSIRILATPLDDIVINPLFLYENGEASQISYFHIDGISFYKDEVCGNLYPYGNRFDMLGKERTFNLEVHKNNTLLLKKKIIVKSGTETCIKGYRMKVRTEKIELLNMDYIEAIHNSGSRCTVYIKYTPKE